MGNEHELIHWGVKGMRWGVRRSKAQLARARKISKKSKSEDVHDDYRKARAKGVKSMSDQELRDANNRLQMEKQYGKLTAKKNRGKQVADAFVATATTIASLVGAAAAYEKYGKAAINKFRDIKISSSQAKWLL